MFSPEPDSPSFDVVLNGVCAEYADVERLEMFAADVDVVTYEFENVPAATAMVLAAHKPVLPAYKILETTQDRLIEKDFVVKLGIGTADYADVSSPETLTDKREQHSVNGSGRWERISFRKRARIGFAKTRVRRFDVKSLHGVTLRYSSPSPARRL